MAGAGSNRQGAGSGRYRRTAQKTQDRGAYTYVEGTAARRLDVQVSPEEPKRETSSETKKNRERALQMNLGYVIFLTVAAVVTMLVCVNFLQLRAKGTLLKKEVTALAAELDAAVLENDSDYNQVMNGVDLEHVKEVAMNELGMVRASASQIETYEATGGDYVRQYAEIPEDN